MVTDRFLALFFWSCCLALDHPGNLSSRGGGETPPACRPSERWELDTRASSSAGWWGQPSEVSWVAATLATWGPWWSQNMENIMDQWSHLFISHVDMTIISIPNHQPRTQKPRRNHHINYILGWDWDLFQLMAGCSPLGSLSPLVSLKCSLSS